MGFLKTHIRCKGANRSSGFKASPNTSRHEESRRSTTDTEHLESSVLRESRSQPILTSTPVSTDSKIPEHFDQMRTLISGFLQQKSDRQPFFDYVASEAEKMTQEEFEDLNGRILIDIEAVKNTHRHQVLPKISPLLPKNHRGSGYCQQPLNRHLVPPRQQQAAVQQLRLLHTQPHWLWKPSISAHSTGRGQQTQLKWNTKPDTRSNTDH